MHRWPPLLHNMSMRPRTNVSWRLDPVESQIVVLTLASTGRSCAEIFASSETLRRQFERDWESFGLKGAMLVYNAPELDPEPTPDVTDPTATVWTTRVVCTYGSTRTTPTHVIHTGGAIAGPAPMSRRPARPHTPSEPGWPILRALDLSLIVNVLGRASSHALIATAPLALEPHFLERRLATDDPRIVRLALERGADWSDH